MRLRVKVLLLCFMLLFTLQFTTYAHVHMSESIPADGSLLEQTPDEIKVKFTDKINMELSKLILTNELGLEIITTQSGEDGIWLNAHVPSLENGEYTVAWKVLALDGHSSEGSFEFVVDVASAEQPNEVDLELGDINMVESSEGDEERITEHEHSGHHVDPIAEHEHENEHSTQHLEVSNKANGQEQAQTQTQTQTNKWSTLLRIIDIITVVIVGGSMFFRYIIWNQGIAPSWFSLVKERLIYSTGAVILAVTGYIHLYLLTAQFSSRIDPAFWKTFGQLLTSSNVGIVSWLQPVILILLLGETYINRKRTEEGRMYAASIVFKFFLIICLMITFPYTGHAMGGNMLWGIPIISHTLHLLAAAVWIGGIIGIIVLTFKLVKSIETLNILNNILHRFSAFALPIVILISVTSIVLTVIRLDSWTDLWQTPYGLLILSKSIIFSSILIIAGCHRFIWLPKLNNILNMQNLEATEASESKTITTLLWGIRAELILAVIVILLAGFLSTTSPP